MSKFAVVDNVNGAFAVRTEHNDEQSALVSFHDRCKVLWNASDVVKASVKILDADLNVFQGKSEVITHEDEEG